LVEVAIKRFVPTRNTEGFADEREKRLVEAGVMISTFRGRRVFWLLAVWTVPTTRRAQIENCNIFIAFKDGLLAEHNKEARKRRFSTGVSSPAPVRNRAIAGIESGGCTVMIGS
jgi:hypothetical protein